MNLLTKFSSKQILSSFRLLSQGTVGREIPEEPRLVFLKKFSANNSALSDAKVNTPGPLNRRNIVDLHC